MNKRNNILSVGLLVIVLAMLTVEIGEMRNSVAMASLPVLTCHQGEREIEPNNTQTQAKQNPPFCFGKTYRGLPTDRWDMFAYDLPATGKISAVITNLHWDETRVGVLLITDSGVEVARDDTPGDGLSINSNILLPGRYLLAIFIDRPNGNETAEYDFLVDFELPPPACYILTRTHSGQGSDPTASPANSSGCPIGQYILGQSINLAASPALGHRVKNWSGTNNNSSTSITNIITMPARNHTVVVTYEIIPGETFWFYTPLALHIPQVCFTGPNEQEPNNNQSLANGPLCRGQVYYGRPNNASDNFDMYYLDVNQSGAITIALLNHPGNSVQLALYYQVVAGNPVVKADGIRGDLQITAPNAQPGRYYVVIYAVEPNISSAAPYTLQANFAGR